MFNYESKIYSKKQKFNMPFLNGGIVGLLPVELNKLDPNAKVLDVGCGAGYYTSEILKKKFPKLRITGIDISKSAIAQAKKSYRDVVFNVGSAYKLPFKKGSFDTVILNCTLEHLEQPEKALQEVRRVLKKGSLFFSITPIEGQKEVSWQDKNLSKRYHGHLTRFNKNMLEKLIKGSGFNIKRSYHTGFWFCQFVSGIYMRVFKATNKDACYQISGKLSPIKYLVNLIINIESMLLTHLGLTGLYMHVVSYSNK